MDRHNGLWCGKKRYTKYAINANQYTNQYTFERSCTDEDHQAQRRGEGLRHHED